MTPQEFQFASREFHTLLHEPGNLTSAAEFAEALEVLDLVQADGPVLRKCCAAEVKLLRLACCPFCKTATLLEGPRGGLCVNVKCSVCESEWNIAPIDACCELLSPPKILEPRA